MDAKKTMSSSGWADEAANVAQGAIERMREYAVKMESDMTNMAGPSAAKMTAGLEGRANAIAGFMEKRPMETALVAMAVGMLASRAAKKAKASEKPAGRKAA